MSDAEDLGPYYYPKGKPSPKPGKAPKIGDNVLDLGTIFEISDSHLKTSQGPEDWILHLCGLVPQGPGEWLYAPPMVGDRLRWNHVVTKIARVEPEYVLSQEGAVFPISELVRTRPHAWQHEQPPKVSDPEPGQTINYAGALWTIESVWQGNVIAESKGGRKTFVQSRLRQEGEGTWSHVPI